MPTLSARTILAADWGKAAAKRRAVRICVETRRVERVPPADAASLERLLALGSGPGTLVGIDAVVGIPEYVGRACGTSDFLDWLDQGQSRCGFFEAVKRAEEWSPWRPFWVNPPGKGAQKRFFSDVGRFHPELRLRPGHALKRRVDHWAAAKPPTCVSGMPGTVGSGTRALWQELPSLLGSLAVWPFSGIDLVRLLSGRRPVLVEAYPAICYGIALAERLPAAPWSIAKTQRGARQAALQRLSRHPAWAPDVEIAEDIWLAATDSEDDFDALFLALALFRLVLERRLDPTGDETSPPVDPHFEGGIVGSWAVVKQASGGKSVAAIREQTSPSPAARGGGAVTCPLCDHEFRLGRCGWDAHVASRRKHPEWHPGEKDAGRRKRLFLEEFPKFLGTTLMTPRDRRDVELFLDGHVRVEPDGRQVLPAVVTQLVEEALAAPGLMDEIPSVNDDWIKVAGFRRGGFDVDIHGSPIVPQVIEDFVRLGLRLRGA